MNSRDTEMLKAIWSRVTILIGGVFLFAQVATAQTPLPPVSIGVSQSTIAGAVRYQYQVTNKSPFPVTTVVIGYSYLRGQPELQTAPVGWSVTGGLPSSSVTSPDGWTATIIPTEDTTLLQLEWDEPSPSGAIPPGETRVFSVLVPQADTSYASSDWTVYVDGAAATYYAGTLVPTTIPCDTPRLAVSLAPNILWPPNHKLVTINASISVQDDNYPDPLVQLVSITANEPLNSGDVVAQFGTAAQSFQVRSERKGTNKAGRVYTVTYSATNSCGNSTTATETVVIPHDQGGS